MAPFKKEQKKLEVIKNNTFSFLHWKCFLCAEAACKGKYVFKLNLSDCTDTDVLVNRAKETAMVFRAIRPKCVV